MIKLLNGYLYSYARLRFTGLNTNDILNIASLNGITIKNAQRTDYAQMEADVYFKDINKLKKLLGKNKYKIETIKKRGAAYKISANKKRIFLWIGMFIALVGLGVVFSRTWSIKVIGYGEPQKIVEIVKSNNMLNWKHGLGDKIEELQMQILKSDSNILWNSATINGTVVEVYVKENNSIKLPPKTQGNLVANKDCVIRNLIVTGGTGRVTNGTTVSKGDILIEASQKIGEEIYPVNAQGKAIASVYYSLSQTIPINQTEYVETGNKKTVCNMELLGMNILAGGKNEFVNSNVYNESINTFGLPIKITRVVYCETQAEQKSVDIDAAVKEAQRQIITALKQQIPETSEIYKTDTTITRNDDTVTVYTYIEAIEDVAVRG